MVREGRALTNLVNSFCKDTALFPNDHNPKQGNLYENTEMINSNFFATTERYVSTRSSAGISTRKATVYACVTSGGRLVSLQKIQMQCMLHTHDY